MIQVTGTNFPAGNDIKCVFKGVEALGTFTSATGVDCTFTTGVPAADTPVAPSIMFTDSVSGITQTADANG